ncbi:MAG: 5'-methylthioadenosine/S-adenosylhomocysteine nucleosidase [Syntrophorhabdaceae bacterium PtaU1.Bin034]|jgi:nucleoside phosphorylase|nr:MAG: 5'-methylthioadenosine/S-adenosylhomocysteine nucleosidase [Syntrophorhabdaceae bacterium PtaU1.Bin034]
MKLLLLSALPREVSAIARMLGPKTRLPHLPPGSFRVRHGGHEITIAETGMGVERAARLYDLIVPRITPDMIISLGYCGALAEGIGVGDLVKASSVYLINGNKIERSPLPDSGRLGAAFSSGLPIRDAAFLTLARWMKKREILPLVPPDAPLPVCDMETFPLAKLSLENGIPFLAIRSVSDVAAEDFAFSPADVCDKSGRYSVRRALGLFLFRPRLLPHALKLRKSSGRASASLARAIDALLRIM